MSGAKPFTVSFIREMADAFGWFFDPLELEALIILDRAARNPGPELRDEKRGGAG